MSPDELTSPDGYRDPPSRRSCLPIALVVCIVAGIAIYLYTRHRNRQLEQVIGTSGRLTLAEDDGKDLKQIDRQGSPEVYYRVTLEQVPSGTSLSLACDWIDPTGERVHRNRYQTKPIDHTPWPTYARYRFDPRSRTGTWTVVLLLDERVLYSRTFEVGDGKPQDR